VVGEPLNEGQAIESLRWSYEPRGNVEHIAAHDVTPEDVLLVLSLAPRFFGDRQNPESTIAIGPNPNGRYLAIVLLPTFVPGEWVVATAHWLGRRGKLLYERGVSNER
jgi:hypothetical protein